MAEETIIKVKLWGIIALIVVCLGYLVTSDRGIENRVTKIETQYEAVMSNINEMKTILKDVRQDQIRRYQKEINGK